jgi:hypothetical protein
MRQALLIVLLLAAAAASERCESENCRPAPHIATCTDLHCYRCGKN